MFLLRPVEDEGFNDKPRTWWEFLFDESLLNSHLDALRDGSAEHPSAQVLIQTFLDKGDQYSASKQGDDAEHHSKILHRAAVIAHKLDLSLEELCSYVPNRMQLSRLLSAIQTLYGQEDATSHAMLHLWQIDVLCTYDPFHPLPEGLARLEPTATIGALQACLQEAPEALEKLITFSLGKAYLLLQDEPQTALQYFNKLAPSAQVSRWIESCSESTTEGAPPKRRKKEDAASVERALPEFAPRQTCNPMAACFDSGEGSFQDGLWKSFVAHQSGKEWESTLSSWLAAQPNARSVRVVVDAVGAMENGDALSSLLKMCLRFCFRADSAAVAWSVVGVLPPSEPVADPIVQIGLACCKALTRVVTNGSEVPYLEAESDILFATGRYKASLRLLMSHMTVHPVWPLPMAVLLRCIAICKNAHWTVLRCVFLQMVPDERALTDAYNAIRVAPMEQLDVRYLPWIYDNSLLELLIYRFEKHAESTIVKQLIAQIASSRTAALNYERNGRDRDPSLSRCFFQSLWHKLSSF